MTDFSPTKREQEKLDKIAKEEKKMDESNEEDEYEEEKDDKKSEKKSSNKHRKINAIKNSRSFFNDTDKV